MLAGLFESLGEPFIKGIIYLRAGRLVFPKKIQIFSGADFKMLGKTFLTFPQKFFQFPAKLKKLLREKSQNVPLKISIFFGTKNKGLHDLSANPYIYIRIAKGN